MPATGRQNNRGQGQNREAEQRETWSMSRAQRGEVRDGGPDGNGENQNPNIIVWSLGLDNYVPTIQRVNNIATINIIKTNFIIRTYLFHGTMVFISIALSLLPPIIVLTIQTMVAKL